MSLAQNYISPRVFDLRWSSRYQIVAGIKSYNISAPCYCAACQKLEFLASNRGIQSLLFYFVIKAQNQAQNQAQNHQPEPKKTHTKYSSWPFSDQGQRAEPR